MEFAPGMDQRVVCRTNRRDQVSPTTYETDEVTPATEPFGGSVDERMANHDEIVNEFPLCDGRVTKGDSGVKQLPRCVLSVVLTLLPIVSGWGDERVGEFDIPEVIPLNERALWKLREISKTDPEAKAIVAEVRREAEPLLEVIPRPLKVIHYEGLVNTDPKRIATVEKLRQMGDAARLLRYWQATGDDKAAATLEKLIIAWAETYEPTGNDVNENKLYPLLAAYEALQDSFDEADRQLVDAWVLQIGELHAKAVDKSSHLTNRYSKHLRLAALCGLILDRPEWIAGALDGVKRFVSHSLRKDGTSLDLERRDSLGYHGSALRPPMQLAILAGEKGRALYTWESPEGGSLKKSVDYLVPYAMGEKEHREWVNTKVELDRRRAAAGLKKYQPGKPYDPQDALKVMELASYFDPGLNRVVVHLTNSSAKRSPTWTSLTNAALARGMQD